MMENVQLIILDIMDKLLTAVEQKVNTEEHEQLQETINELNLSSSQGSASESSSSDSESTLSFARLKGEGSDSEEEKDSGKRTDPVGTVELNSPMVLDSQFTAVRTVNVHAVPKAPYKGKVPTAYNPKRSVSKGKDVDKLIEQARAMGVHDPELEALAKPQMLNLDSMNFTVAPASNGAAKRTPGAQAVWDP